MKYIIIFGILALVIAGCATTAIPKEKLANTSTIKNAQGHADLSKDEISPEELNDKLQKAGTPNEQKFILLDVREQNEFEQAHIPGTTNLISVKNISAKTLQQAGINPEDEIVVYCHSGARSHIAATTMRSLGYKNVRELNSGITHWTEDGYPTESGPQQFSTQQQTAETQTSNDAQISFDQTSYNFGQIKQFGGTVQTTFKVKNSGKKELKIGTITTSCSCTTTKIGTTTIKPGEETTLTVTFNPNLHEEPKDKFKRTIFIPSNDPNNAEAELNILVDILEGE